MRQTHRTKGDISDEFKDGDVSNESGHLPQTDLTTPVVVDKDMRRFFGCEVVVYGNVVIRGGAGAGSDNTIEKSTRHPHSEWNSLTLI
jgi:hypothetical protein